MKDPTLVRIALLLGLEAIGTVDNAAHVRTDQCRIGGVLEHVNSSPIKCLGHLAAYRADVTTRVRSASPTDTHDSGADDIAAAEMTGDDQASRTIDKLSRAGTIDTPR